MDLQGRIETLDMKPAHSYYVPPNVSYRIETRGRLVLELFGPADSRTQCFDEEVLAADFFDTAAKTEGHSG
jgi:mannose-6-phosphate isomerase-like protein (cupin superfamily)